MVWRATSISENPSIIFSGPFNITGTTHRLTDSSSSSFIIAIAAFAFLEASYVLSSDVTLLIE